MIVSKSLYHSDLVFVFRPENYFIPDNARVSGAFAVSQNAAASLLDDPILKYKQVKLPAAGLQLTFEANRLRIDDLALKGVDEPDFGREAVRIVDALFDKPGLEAYGYNFDAYYRFSQVLPIAEIFAKNFGGQYLEKNDLLDYGFQLTSRDAKTGAKDTWFFKITAPLELAVHLNRHIDSKELPNAENLSADLKKCYNQMDFLVESIKF